MTDVDNLSPELIALLTKISKGNHLFMTLDTCKSDHLDFREVAVWNVKKALLEAYEAGVKSQLPFLQGLMTYVEDGNVTELRKCGFVKELSDRIQELENTLEFTTAVFDELGSNNEIDRATVHLTKYHIQQLIDAVVLLCEGDSSVEDLSTVAKELNLI